MSDRKRIIVITIAIIGCLSLLFNAYWLINFSVSKIQEKAAITAQQQIVKVIIDAVAQSGEVAITIPDKSGDNKKFILVAKNTNVGISSGTTPDAKLEVQKTGEINEPTSGQEVPE